VALPKTPISVSVSPDGRRAAVSHDGFVSEIDLETAALLASLPLPSQGGDVVCAANGFAYVFDKEGQWIGVQGVEIATGRVVSSNAGVFAAGPRPSSGPTAWRCTLYNAALPERSRAQVGFGAG
jgi:DNA-binding beta-propeller fold protein YncE